MKSCLLCPKGPRCRGYILYLLILKLHDAMSQGMDSDAIIRELSREDMTIIADLGDKARATCWTKAFVLVVARKVADITNTAKDDDIKLRSGIERMIVQMDMLFGKLPKGITIDLAELAMEVYNTACEMLEEQGSSAMLPANLVDQVCAKAASKKTG